jgi:hypothetical protein
MTKEVSENPENGLELEDAVEPRIASVPAFACKPALASGYPQRMKKQI